MKTHPISRTALGTVLGVAMLTAPVAATAAEGDIVLVKGISYDTEMSNFRGLFKFCQRSIGIDERF